MKSDAIRQLFCERYLAGIPYSDICRELGISKRTAGNWAREMGLRRRRGGPHRHRWVPGKRRKSGDYGIS
jgi:transposase-like protein